MDITRSAGNKLIDAGPVLVPVVVPFISNGASMIGVVMEAATEFLGGTIDKVERIADWIKKLTRTDGFVTDDNFVGIVIGMNIVVFTNDVEVEGEVRTKVATPVLDGAELLPVVPDVVAEAP